MWNFTVRAIMRPKLPVSHTDDSVQSETVTQRSLADITVEDLMIGRYTCTCTVFLLIYWHAFITEGAGICEVAVERTKLTSPILKHAVKLPKNGIKCTELICDHRIFKIKTNYE